MDTMGTNRVRVVATAVLGFALVALSGGSASAQSAAARRAAMWDAYQASRPTAERVWLPAVLGYELAAQAEVKAANKANIADEYKSAKRCGGGVVDLAAIHAYQERIREADAEIVRLKGLARSEGIKPAKASSDQVQAVATCVHAANDSTLRNERNFSAEDAEAGSCFWLYLLHCEFSGNGESVRGWVSQTFGR